MGTAYGTVLDLNKGNLTEVNILEAIENAPKNTLNRVTMYGRITTAIEPAGYLADLELAKGFYVLVETVGIQSDVINFRESSSKINLAVGSIVAVCTDPSLIGKWVKVKNSGRQPLTNLRCGKNFGPDRFDTLNVLNFGKDRTGGWVVYPNLFEEIVIGQKSNSLEEMVANLSVSNFILRSSTLLDNPDYRPFRGLPEELVVKKAVGGGFKSNLSSVPEETYGDVMEVDSSKNRISSNEGPQSLVHRLQSLEMFSGIDDIRAEVERCREARDLFASEITYDYSLSRWRRNALLMGYRLCVVSDQGSRFTGTSKRKSTSLEDVIESLVDKTGIRDRALLDFEDSPSLFASGKTGVDELNNLDYLFVAVVDDLCGTHMTPKVVKKLVGDPSVFVSYLITNPYALAVMLGLSLSDADNIFALLSGMSTPEWFGDGSQFTKYRDVLIALDAVMNQDNPSSIVSRREVAKGVAINKRQRVSLDKFGMTLSDLQWNIISDVFSGVYRALGRYCPNGLEEGNLLVGIDNWGMTTEVEFVENPTSAVNFGSVTHKTMGWYSGGTFFVPSMGVNLFETLDDWGIIVSVEDQVISSTYLEMEEFIYSKAYEMSNLPTGISDSVIDTAIKMYEGEKGFQLEDLQRDGVKLVKNHFGVLSGQAGSGKTTVSEAFVKALKLGLPGYNIMFAAPTGKAARRMKEVLGSLGTVKTIHSLFSLSVDVPRMFSIPGSKVWEGTPSESNAVYILDEMAMSTTSMLYNVMKKIPSDGCLYLLGDIKQLPPIGKGMPFRDLLNSMPAVELGVSKRAKEGSGINLNCDLINQHSGSREFKDLKNANDFKLVPCSDTEIVNAIVAGVKNNITRMNPEDIQVATPYAKPEKQWSSSSLNPILQSIFLPEAPVLFTHGNREFREGARVIHVKRNLYGKLKYKYDGKGVLTQVKSHGVVNGEVGTLVGIVSALDVDFKIDKNYNMELEEKGLEPILDWDYDQSKVSKIYFVLMEVVDPDLNDTCIILYEARTGGAGYTESDGYPLMGSALNNLELAYALTVHKLQGSQAKMVIIPLAGSDYPGFVNRNMLYTAVSRAQETVVVLGSVSGPSSMANLSRANTDVNSVTSILSIMTGVKKLGK